MCDFSLQSAKSRPAQVADKLRTHNFGRGTIGFCGIDDSIGDATAVCVLPGTEIAFEKVPELRYAETDKQPKHAVAIFRQINKDTPNTHHDALEFPDGLVTLLTMLDDGQPAIVLQLPAAPRTAAEEKDQQRLEVVG